MTQLAAQQATGEQPSVESKLIALRDALTQEAKNELPAGTALAMLEKDPALARVETGLSNGPYTPVIPFSIIFHAIDVKNYPFIRACLKHGSSPNAVRTKQDFGGDFETVFEILMEESICDEQNVATLEALLEHPDSSIDVNTTLLFCARKLMAGAAPTPELQARRRAICEELIQRTRAELLVNEGSLAEYIRITDVHPTTAVDEDITISLTRMLADRSVDLDKISGKLYFPLEVMRRNRQPRAAAALLAAGADTSSPEAHRKWRKTIGIEEHLHRLQLGSEQDRLFSLSAEQGCKQILDDEIARITVKHEPPDAVLFTPEGRPSWQAQGLVMRGRIRELFDPRQAPLFGGAAQQYDLAERLSDALPQRQRDRFNLTGLLRDTALARPESEVAVRYVRGEAAAAGKGAA